ncbi:MAG: hypothetical protein BWX80_02123 [Candidatus Hydrogenedentes bacterium ADurb.Bin101]|nr:MAG: hypothetical protein BWX80_02123 [Candidatus Hydrogenedentes bacterium ADurb.Bin101]
MDFFQVRQRDIALPREHLIYIIAPGEGAHIPFGDIADAARVPQPLAGHQGNVPEGRAAEGAQDRLVRAGQPRYFRPVPVQVFIADGRELLQVILHVKFVVVYGVLADDRVKIKTAFRHAPAGLEGHVALGVHQNIAVRLRRRIEGPRHQHRRAVEQAPLLPVFIPEPEHVTRPANAHHVHAQGLLKVRRNFSQHLVRLHHLDRGAGRIQPQRLAQQIHGTHLHAGNGCGAEVQGDAVRFLMIQRCMDTFTGGHGHKTFPLFYPGVRGGNFRKIARSISGGKAYYFYLNALLNTSLSQVQHLSGNFFCQIIFAAVAAHFRRHFFDDNYCASAFKGYGHLPRVGITLSA